MKAGDCFTLRCDVSERVYRGFLDTFDDRNPLHTDAAFAVSKGFAGAVMHGNILGGFLSRLIGEGLSDRNVIIQSQTMNFRRPVYLGDTLMLTATVTDVFESVDTMELRFDFVNGSGVRVANGTVLLGALR